MAFNAKKFRPIIMACTVPVEKSDEPLEFFVREPSGREILQEAAQDRKGKTAIDHARELFAKFVVSDETGTALTADEVDDMLDMPFQVVMAASDVVQERIGIKKAAPAIGADGKPVEPAKNA